MPEAYRPFVQAYAQYRVKGSYTMSRQSVWGCRVCISVSRASRRTASEMRAAVRTITLNARRAAVPIGQSARNASISSTDHGEWSRASLREACRNPRGPPGPGLSQSPSLFGRPVRDALAGCDHSCRRRLSLIHTSKSSSSSWSRTCVFNSSIARMPCIARNVRVAICGSEALARIRARKSPS